MAKKDKKIKDKTIEMPSIGITNPQMDPMAAMTMNMGGIPGQNRGATAPKPTAQANATAMSPNTKDKKKKKNSKKGVDTVTKDQLTEFKKKNAGVDLSKLTPEQLSQLQLEEAIKESSNPSANLIKLKNPLGIKGCLLNALFFVILTLGIVILVCYLRIDNFHLGVVLKDMLTKFGIWQFFAKIFTTIGGWFTPKSSIIMLMMSVFGI